MTEVATTQPLSFRAAAEVLKQDDKTGRALKTVVLQREEELGIQIATRLGDSKKQHLRITLSALYKHCPEFRPHRTNNDMERSVRAYISAIEERISEVAADEVQKLVMPRFRDVERQLDEMREQDARTLGLVEGLAAQVAGAVGVKKAV